MGTGSRRCAWLIALFCAVGAVACTAGIGPPEATPEIFILEGLIAQYGQETPCYQDDTETTAHHNVLCGTAGTLAVDLQPQMPLVQVQLEPFAIDQHEVSNAQYRHCEKTGPCREPLFTDSWVQGNDYYFNPDYDDYPVHQVTWAMAQDYCAFRGRRLPTNVEWQRVAQGSPVLREELRKYPVEDAQKLNDCQSKDIPGAACNGKTDLVAVDLENDDYVEEGFDKDLNPGRVYHLFSNVSEFTDGKFSEIATCKAPLPADNFPSPGGGASDDFTDCISCLDCLLYQPASDESIWCNQECKTCEACSGTSVLGAPYMPEDYPGDSVDCHIDCWGETRESPRCVRWSIDEMPLPPEVVEKEGNVDDKVQVSVRGGHVGIVSNNKDICRFRSDHRAMRVNPDGSTSNGNNATEKGLGFRCARSLTGDERTTLMDHATKARFAHLDPNSSTVESAEFTQPPFEAPAEPLTEPEPVSDSNAEDDAGETPSDTSSGPDGD
jgi:hypothetical protein